MLFLNLMALPFHNVVSLNINTSTALLMAADEPAKHRSVILRNPYVAMRK